MYAACGAVSRADHEKIQAELEAAAEAQKEAKEDLKKESKSRKEAEKKFEDAEAEIAEVKEAKEKLEKLSTDNKKASETKGADLDKAKKEVDKLKADLDKEKAAAVAALSQLAEAKERADKAEAELAAKVAEAERLAAEAEAALASVAEVRLEAEQAETALAAEIIKEDKLKKPPPVWSTGLCSCCAKPGGPGLCVKSFCCPCLVTGKMNASLKVDGIAPCPGGCPGGCCLGCCCFPCYMCKAGPAVANKVGRVEGKCKACMCGLCCPCCYMSQVMRETLLAPTGDPAAEGGAGSPKAAGVEEAPLQETMGEEGEAKPKPEKAAGAKWSTGLCKCCAKPGGVGLCCKGCLCPCMITGKLNKHLKEKEVPACPGGCGGGCCLGCCCMPCFMRKAGPAVATMGGFEEGKCRACMCGMCCPCCYLEQVFRETLILAESG